MQTLVALLPKLLVATEANKLVWTKSGFGKQFAADIGGFELRTWEWQEEHSPEISGITIHLRKDDEVLDDIVTNEFGPNYPPARQLFSAARRSALEVDKAIDALKKALDHL